MIDGDTEIPLALETGMLQLPSLNFSSESFLEDIIVFKDELSQIYFELLQREYQDSDNKLETALIRACYNEDDDAGVLLVSMGVDINRAYNRIYPIEKVCGSKMPKTFDAIIKSGNLDYNLLGFGEHYRYNSPDLLDFAHTYKLFDSFNILLKSGAFHNFEIKTIMEDLSYGHRSYGSNALDFPPEERVEWLKKIIPFGQDNLEETCRSIIKSGDKKVSEVVLLAITEYKIDLIESLLELSEKGWNDVIEACLLENITTYDNSYRARQGFNPYFIAIETNNLELVRLFVKYGIDVNKYHKYPIDGENIREFTYSNPSHPLIYAIEKNNFDIFLELVEITNPKIIQYSLQIVVSDVKLRYLKILIDLGINPSYIDIPEFGVTRDTSILDKALRADQRECVRYLLSLEGIEVNLPREEYHPMIGSSIPPPLASAINSENVYAVQKMLELGARVNEKWGSRFNTRYPIILALESKNLEVINMLITHLDIDLNCEFKFYDISEIMTPISYVIEKNLGEDIALALLKTNKINLKVEIKYEGSGEEMLYLPLHGAVRHCNSALVNILLQYEPSVVNQYDRYCVTPFLLAMKDFPGKEICDSLIKAGARTDYSYPEEYDSRLTISEHSLGDLESFQYMLYNGIFDNHLNKNHKAPITQETEILYLERDPYLVYHDYELSISRAQEVQKIYSEYQEFIKFGRLTESVIDNIKKAGGWREDLLSSDPRKVEEARMQLLSNAYDHNHLVLPQSFLGEKEDLNTDLRDELQLKLEKDFSNHLITNELGKKIFSISYYQALYLEEHPDHIFVESRYLQSSSLGTGKAMSLVDAAYHMVSNSLIPSICKDTNSSQNVPTTTYSDTKHDGGKGVDESTKSSRSKVFSDVTGYLEGVYQSAAARVKEQATMDPRRYQDFIRELESEGIKASELAGNNIPLQILSEVLNSSGMHIDYGLELSGSFAAKNITTLKTYFDASGQVLGDGVGAGFEVLARVGRKYFGDEFADSLSEYARESFEWIKDHTTEGHRTLGGAAAALVAGKSTSKLFGKFWKPAVGVESGAFVEGAAGVEYASLELKLLQEARSLKLLEDFGLTDKAKNAKIVKNWVAFEQNMEHLSAKLPGFSDIQMKYPDADKTFGVKLKFGGNHHEITVKKGRAGVTEFVSQEADYVSIRSNGQVIAKDGNFIIEISGKEGLYKAPAKRNNPLAPDQSKAVKMEPIKKVYKPASHPEAHISLEEWKEWKDWYKPK